MSARQEALFLGTDPVSGQTLRGAVTAAVDALIAAAAQPGPVTGTSYKDILTGVRALNLDLRQGVGLRSALAEIQIPVLNEGVRLSDPACAAHLHCPPLLASVVADFLAAATNQSMDSFDQAPAATAVERHIVEWLLQLSGMPSGDGVMTSGATLSNLMGLLLARERASGAEATVNDCGLPLEAHRWRILCSERAHFSVTQSAAILGLGRDAVVSLPTDNHDRLTPETVEQGLANLQRSGLRPIALVLTAGTTESGAIDEMQQSTRMAVTNNVWVHVDAAAGGALLLSSRHRHLLDGMETADSVALDGHKLLAQSASCGVFLVRDARQLDRLAAHADYLNPQEDETDGVPNLVTRSLQTTRRFDALKLLLSVRALGQDTLGQIVDAGIDAAALAATLVTNHPELQLLLAPQMNTVLFRWQPHAVSDPMAIDAANSAVHRALWRQGRAVIGRARHSGRPAIKLTLLAPTPDKDQLRALLNDIATCAREHIPRPVTAAQGLQ